MKNLTDFPEDRFIVYEKLARSNFAFLIENYEFKLSDIERGNNYIALKYLSEGVFVNFYYGSPSFELDFYIGRVGIEDKLDKEGFTSGDLLFFSDDARWSNYKLYSAHSYKNLCKCLPKLAQLLKICGADCLTGESAAYEKMLFEKKNKTNQWCNQQEFKQIKKAASEAWKNKDYVKFIELLEPVVNTLSLSEKKKLEYSRKKKIKSTDFSK